MPPRRLVLPIPLLLIVLLAWGAPSAQAYLFFANYNEDAIGRVNSDGSNMQPRWLTQIHDPVAVASDDSNVYWASHEGEAAATVGSVGFDGAGFRASIFVAPMAPGQLAVGGGRLFLTGDTTLPCVKIGDTYESPDNAAVLQMATTAEGDDIETLANGSCISFGGVAASHESAYWIDQGYEAWEGDELPTIHQSSVDRSVSQIVIGSAQLEEPGGLTADGEHLYWQDKHSIGRATLKPDGSVEAVDRDFISGLHGPAYPTVDGRYIYWVELGQYELEIYRADKQTGAGIQSLVSIPNTEDFFSGNIPYGLTATEPEVHAALDTEALAFGSRQVGAGPGQPQIVLLSSSGELPVSASQVEVSGPAATDFTVENGCQQQVPTPAACGVVIRFQPHAPGKRTATLTITNDAEESPFHVALSGAGLGPAIAITPTSADFGSQEVKAGPTASQVFTIENVGNEPMQVDEAVLSDPVDFVFESEPEVDCGEAAIAPGKSCTIEVSFNPASPGAKSATLQVGADAPAVPATATATLSGTGTKPGLTISPSAVSFPTTGVGDASAAQTVTISNPGTAPLEVSGVSVVGSTANQFQVSSSCAVLAPGSSCAAEVSFEPTAVGTKLAYLQVLTNYFGTNASTSLRGTAVSPEASLTPSEADFGSRNLGSGAGAVTTFAFKSTGSEELEVEGVEIGGADADQFTLLAGADECSGAQLETGEECTVGVVFDPAQIGPLAATLEIDDDVFPAPHTALLEGTGTAPRIALRPEALACPALLLGAGDRQRFAIGNPGSGPLTVGSVKLSGPGAAAYAVDAGSCTATPIAAGAAAGCTVTVSFTPGASGALPATLTIASDAASGPTTVALSGTGCPPLSAAASALKPPRPFAFSVRVETSGPTTLALNATLRYRAHGKPRSVALGARSVEPGGSLVFAVPAKLRKQIEPGQRVNLLLRGSGVPRGVPGCAAQPVLDQALAVKVGGKPKKKGHTGRRQR